MFDVLAFLKSKMMNDGKDVPKDGRNHRAVEEGMMVVEAEGEMHDDHWVLDDRMKRMIMDLQRHWLTDYQQSREKLLVEMTERVSMNLIFLVELLLFKIKKQNVIWREKCEYNFIRLLIHETGCLEVVMLTIR